MIGLNLYEKRNETMATPYNHKEVETKWRKFWEENEKYYNTD